MLIMLESVDVGTTMTQIVAENADKIAKALGIKYDEIKVNLFSHAPWDSDIMFYKDGKIVLRIEVKTCTSRHRLKDNIARIRRSLRHDELGVIVVAIGYKKKGERKAEVGLLMIVLTKDYLEELNPSEVIDEINILLRRKAEEEDYEQLFITNFRDKLIIEAWVSSMILRDTLERIEQEMATKKDLERFATKEDLKELEMRILKKMEEMFLEMKNMLMNQ